MKPNRNIEMAILQRKDKFALCVPEHIKDKDAYLRRLAFDTQVMITKNPKLAQCDPTSLVMCAMRAANYKLTFSEGECSIIPFKRTATFVMGPTGIARLLYRTGLFQRIEWETVRENDHFEHVLGSEADVVFRKALKNRGDVLCAYAVAVMKDGTKHVYIMDYDKLMQIKASSPSGGNTYRDWADEMHAKAPLKRLVKRLPVDPIDSPELKSALGAIRSDNTYQKDPEGPEMGSWDLVDRNTGEVTYPDGETEEDRQRMARINAAIEQKRVEAEAPPKKRRRRKKTVEKAVEKPASERPLTPEEVDSLEEWSRGEQEKVEAQVNEAVAAADTLL